MRYIQSKWFYNQASKYRQGAHSEKMKQQQQRRQKKWFSCGTLLYLFHRNSAECRLPFLLYHPHNAELSPTQPFCFTGLWLSCWLRLVKWHCLLYTHTHPFSMNPCAYYLAQITLCQTKMPWMLRVLGIAEFSILCADVLLWVHFAHLCCVLLDNIAKFLDSTVW